MVISEIAAATMIAVCGLQRSYRIVLYAERGVRRRIGRESPILAGYNTFPRFFIRRVFQAGLAIALRMEGRAKTAARRAATARSSLADGRAAMKEAVRERRRDLRGRVLPRAAAVAVRLSRRRARVAATLSTRTAAIRAAAAAVAAASGPVDRAAPPLSVSRRWGRVSAPALGGAPPAGLGAVLHPAPCGVRSRAGRGTAGQPQPPGATT